jgi:hypothetical protein
MLLGNILAHDQSAKSSSQQFGLNTYTVYSCKLNTDPVYSCKLNTDSVYGYKLNTYPVNSLNKFQTIWQNLIGCWPNLTWPSPSLALPEALIPFHSLVSFVGNFFMYV